VRKSGFFRRVLRSVWLKVGIVLLSIGILAYFNRIDMAVLYGLADTWPWLVGAFLFTLPPFGIVSYRFKIILSSQQIGVSQYQAVRWTMIGSFFDLAMPSSNGGDLIKAGYVVKHVGAGLRTRAVMALAFDRVIGLLGLFCWQHWSASSVGMCYAISVSKLGPSDISLGRARPIGGAASRGFQTPIQEQTNRCMAFGPAMGLQAQADHRFAQCTSGKSSGACGSAELVDVESCILVLGPAVHFLCSRGCNCTYERI
jgi:hypothetical protein